MQQHQMINFLIVIDQWFRVDYNYIIMLSEINVKKYYIGRNILKGKTY